MHTLTNTQYLMSIMREYKMKSLCARILLQLSQHQSNKLLLAKPSLRASLAFVTQPSLPRDVILL